MSDYDHLWANKKYPVLNCLALQRRPVVHLTFAVGVSIVIGLGWRFAGVTSTDGDGFQYRARSRDRMTTKRPCVIRLVYMRTPHEDMSLPLKMMSSPPSSSVRLNHPIDLFSCAPYG